MLKKFVTHVAISVVSIVITSCISIPDENTLSPAEQKEELISTQLKLVKIHLDSGNAPKAWANLRALAQAEPTNAKVLNLAGITHLALRNYPEARKYFEKSYRIDQDPASALNLSSTLISLNQMKKARSILAKLLKYNADYPFMERVYHNIGLTFHRQGDLVRAEKFYKKAIVQNPNYYLSTIQLAHVYQKLKRDQTAIQTLKTAITLCETCFEPVKNLATIYMKNNNSDKAVAIITDFLTRKEVSPADQKNAARMLAMSQKASKK